MKAAHVVGVLAVCSLSAPIVGGYVFFDGRPRWPSPEAEFQMDVACTSSNCSRELWNDAFDEAMEAWNERTTFAFRGVRSYREPCDVTDNLNGVGFSDTNCGIDWGATTIAYTRAWHVGNRITDAGIVFNRNVSWNVYSGPLKFTESLEPLYDFRRIAVHELGHALGLDHEDDVPAIMQTNFSSFIEVPQQDDITGVGELYGADTPDPPPIPDRPVNDSWENAIRITGDSGTTTGANTGATWEFEWENTSLVGSRSVFWEWRPDSDGTATFDTIGSNFDTVLSAYSGDASYLTRITYNDDAIGHYPASRISFDVTGGNTYWVRVAGWLGETGRIVLNWSVDVHDSTPMTDGGHLLIFPHLADGEFGGGSVYRTTISLSSGDSRTDCRGTLYGLEADFGEGMTASLDITIPAGGFWSERTSGAVNLQTGYAMVECNRPVSGYLTFALHDPDGTKIAEAAVLPATERETHEMIVDARDGAQVGLAIANNTDQLQFYSLNLRDIDGRLSGLGNVAVPARSNFASLLGDIVTPPPEPEAVYRLEVRNSNAFNGSEFSMIGLQFTGSVFSTLPTHD